MRRAHVLRVYCVQPPVAQPVGLTIFGGQGGLLVGRRCVKARPRQGTRAGQQSQWPRGPMDKASAHGAGDCRFESCRGQLHWKASQEEAAGAREVVPCGLEPQTLRLSAVRSNQLSYETLVCKRESRRKLVAAGGRVVHRKGLPKDGCPKPFTLDFPECVSNQKSCCPRMRFQPKELLSQNASPTKELLAVKVVRAADAGRKPVAAKG